MYQADAKLAAASVAGKEVAAQFLADGKKEAGDADRIRGDAERLEEETNVTANRAKYFDIAEVMLEISIVLCSVTLLTAIRTFWLSSFLTTLAGLVLIAFAALR